MDHPDQIKGKSARLLRGFAKAFNKALNYRIGNVAELLEGNIFYIFRYTLLSTFLTPGGLFTINSSNTITVIRVTSMMCRNWVVCGILMNFYPSLTDIDRSGGAIDDYYWGYWVSFYLNGYNSITTTLSIGDKHHIYDRATP